MEKASVPAVLEGLVSCSRFFVLDQLIHSGFRNSQADAEARSEEATSSVPKCLWLSANDWM
jgi:hypothetical protein